MTLFWLTYLKAGGTEVFIARAGFETVARLKADLAGISGQCMECYQLDVHIAERIPKEMIGRALSRADAERLLECLR
jgi:hypothetical protein